ncbi:hypothetical protein SAMN05444166_8153 [Singulisphaera sp. GP187]|uniref:ribbon-helix-helix domain-containing protein n=1 Tax=Singulisphaera sp. GP187 TaxID=1882752 RepID=UPI000927790B|nr:hypothetical protein [Singulisphaera sp. GP187]SIO66617.1 hypothetical protein SAMN05444166_8153 [Singulisphaera sp. GP187]
MTIQLPKELESSIEAAVHSGRFSSFDEAMAEAARLLLRDLENRPQHGSADFDDDPVIGSMREAAGEMDEIVADAYRKRGEENWRDLPVE